MDAPSAPALFGVDAKRLDAIFQQLLDTEMHARASRLTALCGNDHALRAALETLLAASEAPVPLEGTLGLWRRTCWRCIADAYEGDDEVQLHIKKINSNGGFRE